MNCQTLAKVMVGCMVVAGIAGCEVQKTADDSPTTGSAANSEMANSGQEGELPGPATPAASPANGKSTAKSTPAAKKLGPKSNVASYKPAEGGAIVGDKYSQQRFGVVQGRLVTNFAPAKVRYTLSSESKNGANPVVKLQLRESKGPWITVAEDVVVNGSFSQEYTLSDLEPGAFIFAVSYGATQPADSGRPKLMIESVELLK